MPKRILITLIYFLEKTKAKSPPMLAKEFYAMKKQMQHVWSKDTAIRCVLHGRRIIWSDLRRLS